MSPTMARRGGLGKTVQPNFEITSEKPILRHSNDIHLDDAQEIREIVISSISASAARFFDIQSDQARDDMSGRIMDLTMFALSLFRSESGTEFEPERDPKSSPGAHKIKNAGLIGRILRLSYLSDNGLAGSATLIATGYGMSDQAEIRSTNQRRP